VGRKRLAKWYAAANRRRGELLTKELLRGDLTPEEQTELDGLQKKCLAEVNRVYPLPPTLSVELKTLFMCSRRGK